MTKFNEKFKKVGRIYWIKPISIPGLNSKEIPALCLGKYDKGKTIFIQVGNTDSKIPSSVLATKIFKDNLKPKAKIINSNLHIDISKPEWNTSILKPYLHKGEYVGVNNKAVKKIRHIYCNRRNELRNLRIKKAKIFAIQGQEKKAKKQLQMLKDQEPLKHKKMNVNSLYNKFKKI